MISASQQRALMPMDKGEWRRGRDSNPRKELSSFNGLANPSAGEPPPAEAATNGHSIDIRTERIGRFTRAMLGFTQAQESAHNRVKPIEEQLSRFRIADSGCHEWTGATNGKGYAIIGMGSGVAGKKVLMLAHRLQWMHYNGPIPTGLVVMHRCDNRLCINIKHLCAGSQRDNMQDMIAKGRHNFRGLKNSGASAQNRAQTDRYAWSPSDPFRKSP